MSTRLEKNGTWTAQFRYEDIYGVQRHKCKRGFATQEETQSFEESFLYASRGSMNMKFVDFVDVYADDMKSRLRESTWENKENMINKWLIPFFGRRVMHEIGTKDIITWQNQMLDYERPNGKHFSATYLRTLNNQLVAILNHVFSSTIK